MSTSQAPSTSTWTKTLLAPVHTVHGDPARRHALANCRNVVNAAADRMRTDLSSRNAERVARFKWASEELRARIAEGPGAPPADAYTEVDAETLLRGVCHRARDCADAKDVTLIVHPSPPRVRVRVAELSEAIFNLLVNAIEASARGYPVFAIARATRDGHVLWEVQDSGEGMSPQILAWLGEPFRTTRARGMGLGVAIARANVEAHGGMLSFESAPGVGTTATAWIPGRAWV